MDFGKMECFFSVARYLSFSRAAEDLYLSQSNVTMKINAMEKELGFRLFDRNRQSVRLTLAGEHLFTAWSQLYCQFNAELNQASELAKIPGSSLRIGFHGSPEWAHFYRYAGRFHQLFPHIDLRLKTEGMGILKDLLLNFQIDLAILELAEVVSNPLLVKKELGRGYSAAALPIDHPLAKRSSIKVSECLKETVIMADSTYAPRTLTNIPKRMEKAGLNMSQALQVERFEDALAMCAAGLGIVFLPRLFKQEYSESLSYVDVDSEEMFLDYTLVWHQDNENPLIHQFNRFLKDSDWKIR